MKHARSDYDQIQDPRGLIPEDEPVFLLRAQDVLAPGLVSIWADLAQMIGADPAIVNAAMQQTIEMRKWQSTHKSKVPDMPESAR